jgi:hypothetical protein
LGHTADLDNVQKGCYVLGFEINPFKNTVTSISNNQISAAKRQKNNRRQAVEPGHPSHTIHIPDQRFSTRNQLDGPSHIIIVIIIIRRPVIIGHALNAIPTHPHNDITNTSLWCVASSTK